MNTGQFRQLHGVRRRGVLMPRARLLQEVQALAGRLPPERLVIPELRDRSLFLVTLLATASRGLSCLFAPRDGRETNFATVRIVEQGPQVDDALVLQPLPHCPLAEPMLDVAPPPAHTAVVAATSGSTGQSRRYPKHWGGLFQESAAIGTALQLPSTGTHMIATVPPAHMYGFSYGLIGPLTWGMTLDAECPVFPRDLARLLAAAPAPTWLVTTPVHLRAYVASAEPFPHVAGVISSAAPLPIELARSAEARFAAPLVETYGSTETGAVAWRRPTQDTAWQVYPGVTVAREAAHGQALVCAPWLPTAGQLLDDLIDVHAKGRFAIVGRSSDVIKVGAKRASLGALTETLVTLDGVDDGVIFAPPPTRIDEEPRPAGFVVCAPQALGRIIAALRERVDPVLIPRPLIRVPALPRNATGKLPRAALDALWRAHAQEQESDAR